MNNEETVLEYLEGYFGGSLNEDTTEEDIIEAVVSMNNLCRIINEYFDLTE